jgi:predicted metal-binding membrane protein
MFRLSRPNARDALVLIAVAVACWLVTANRMDGMDMGPGTDLGEPGWFVGVWAVMMAAMMLPSLAPRASVPLAAGFLLPWITAGALAYALVEGVRALDPAFLAWEDAGRYVAGAVIAGAALYELTPAKRSCLRHCREPRLLAARGGAAGFRRGLIDGLYCIGCCWALMAALFALGVMSVAWMVLIAVLIGVEKLLPWEGAAKRLTAALVAVLGIAVAFAPEQVPGLTIPA